MFLLVPAHPGSPGYRAIKRLLLLFGHSKAIMLLKHTQTWYCYNQNTRCFSHNCKYQSRFLTKIYTKKRRMVSQLSSFSQETNHHQTTTTVLRPFFQVHPGEPVPEENFWTLWCKGRLTEADTLTIWLGATPSRLTSAHLNHPLIFFTGRIPFLPPNQQRQSTEGN